MPVPPRVEREERYRPRDNLPSVDDLIADLHAAHGLDALPDLGVIRMRGTITLTIEESKQQAAAAQIAVAQDNSNSLQELNDLFNAQDWAGLIAAYDALDSEMQASGGAQYLRGVAYWQTGDFEPAIVESSVSVATATA